MLLVIYACGKTESIGNKLTDEEIANLRARASAKCNADTNPEFADFISDSNSTMIDFDRNVQEWSLTGSNNTSVTHKIHVWKTTTTAVYFRIFVDDSTPKNIFLKYSKTANEALMKRVQLDGCARSDYTTSVSSSTVTMKKDDSTFTFNTADNKFKQFRTWTFKSSLPGFFGFFEHVLKKQYYDNDGKEISTPAAVTTTYAVKTISEADQPSTNYNDPSYQNGHYCLINSNATQFIDVTRISVSDPLPSNLNCKLVTDNTGITVGAETFAVTEL